MRILLFILTVSIILGCAGIKPPTLLEKLEPEYPREAEEQRLEGSVSMYLLVSEKGEVEQVRIRQSSEHKILDDAAIEYAKKLKFEPARKRGEPTRVLLTWIVNYKSEAVYFQPRDYVAKILDLYRLAAQFTGEEKGRILQDILNAHEDYVRQLSKDPRLNYNTFIQEFVKPEVYERWKDLWDDWPLRFAVYHDFVLRYPDSDEVSYATARLLDLIKDDIRRIKEVAQYKPNVQKKKDLFLKNIYMFLNEQYPQSITEDLRPEAEKFLGKNNSK